MPIPQNNNNPEFYYYYDISRDYYLTDILQDKFLVDNSFKYIWQFCDAFNNIIKMNLRYKIEPDKYSENEINKNINQIHESLKNISKKACLIDTVIDILKYYIFNYKCYEWKLIVRDNYNNDDVMDNLIEEVEHCENIILILINIISNATPSIPHKDELIADAVSLYNKCEKALENN